MAPVQIRAADPLSFVLLTLLQSRREEVRRQDSNFLFPKDLSTWKTAASSIPAACGRGKRTALLWDPLV